ncbi:MAG: MBOAT family protein [Desulfovibrionaceae bacterium]
MLFNSYAFICLFLPLTFLGYFLCHRLGRPVAGKAWLLVASLFFYSWWNVAYLPILLASILVNYFLAYFMLRQNEARPAGQGGWNARRWLFLASMAFNLGLLGYFKYRDFFVGNVNLACGTDFSLLHLALPLGISFFTLQQVAFQVDVYEGLTQENRFLDYAVFVSFFPQLIAGPIVHHMEVIPQFEQMANSRVDARNVAEGLCLFSIGLFKKVVLADTFALWASQGFDHAPSLGALGAWCASLSYTFQLYFDFSGYTDMALGAGLLFNIRIPKNFQSPYKARNIVNFWRQWHITLSNFITTYVYTPMVKLTGRRISFAKSMAAMFAAMFISGLWHGAAWTFVVWGALHGVALVSCHVFRKKKLKMPKTLAWFLTFLFVNASFVIFRATNWHDAFKVLRGMAGLGQAAAGTVNWLMLPSLAVAFGLVLLGRPSTDMVAGTALATRRAYVWYGLLACAALTVLEIRKASEFLYFQF